MLHGAVFVFESSDMHCSALLLLQAMNAFSLLCIALV